MLIGVSGTLGSGKTEIARYLTFRGFKLIAFNATTGPVSEMDGLQIKESALEHELQPALTFDSLQDLITHATNNWMDHFVLTDVTSVDELAQLSKRPFFLHISVDAPLKLRWERYQRHYPALQLADFSDISDAQTFSKETALSDVISKADIKVINTTSNVAELHVQLSDLNVFDQTRLRPSWDAYFMRLADLAALRSNCMKRRVGAVIARDKRVIATGYNGTPRHMTNCNEGGCPRCNNGNGSGAALSTCLCLHAEENALLESGRDRIGSNATLFCNTCPCLTCSVKIVQSGIKEVVYSQSYSMDDHSSRVLREGGVILRQYISPKNGIVI